MQSPIETPGWSSRLKKGETPDRTFDNLGMVMFMQLRNDDRLILGETFGREKAEAVSFRFEYHFTISEPHYHPSNDISELNKACHTPRILRFKKLRKLDHIEMKAFYGKRDLTRNLKNVLELTCETFES